MTPEEVFLGPNPPLLPGFPEPSTPPPARISSVPSFGGGGGGGGFSGITDYHIQNIILKLNFVLSALKIIILFTILKCTTSWVANSWLKKNQQILPCDRYMYRVRERGGAKCFFFVCVCVCVCVCTCVKETGQVKIVWASAAWKSLAQMAGAPKV